MIYSWTIGMGCKMSKELSVKINEELFKKLDNHELNSKGIIDKALHQFFENENQDDEIVTTLKENVQELEKQRELMEIDYVCLVGENKKLQTRIDDLARLYPSAVTLLGKTPTLRLFRRNKKAFK
jgi:cupin superfamily acireductone dioxygenase involved in methionine salvage